MNAPKNHKSKNPFFSLKSEQPQKAEWLMLCFTCVICFFFFLQYFDLRTTNQQGMALIYSVSEGRFWEFYKTCVDSTPCPAVYNIIIYIVFAVWNLPIAVFFKLATGQFDYTSEIQITAGCYWGKLLLVLLTITAAYLVYKIAREGKMSAGKSRWAAYFFAASPVIIFATGMHGQYDIIMVNLLLWALLHYVQGKPYRFAIIMAFAIPCKFFAIAAFIPLILFIEKRVLHIIKFMAIGASVFPLTSLPFMFMPGHSETSAYLAACGFSGRLVENGISSGFGLLSVFAFVMVFSCVYAYKTVLDTPAIRWQYGVYTPLFTIGAALAFIAWHPNWWVIIIPFLALSVFAYEDCKTAMFCAIGFSFFFLITSITQYPNNLDLDMLNHGMIFKLTGFSYSNSISFQSVFKQMGIHYPNFYNAFMVAFLLVMLFLFFPRRMKLSPQSANTFYPPKGAIYAYHLVLYICLVPALIIFLLKLIRLRP